MQTNPLALFGDHLARLRKARGWSQEKLALESGLARSYVSGIERGRRNVALVNICVLADTLGVPTSEMLRFAQATPGAEDAVAPSDRTPLPQISRSLCRLENRDQVWLAEIIRSLSSRLSHAVPPTAVRPYAPAAATVAPTTSTDTHDADVTDESDASRDIGTLTAKSHTGDHDAPRPSFDGTPVRAPIGPGFDGGFPVRHQLATSEQTRYGLADDAPDASRSTTTTATADGCDAPRRICEPDRLSRGDRDGPTRASMAPRSDTGGHDDSRRLPGSDEE